MKNIYLFSLIQFYFGLQLLAQPVVNSDILFSSGDVATVHYIDAPFDPGPAGADVEWDFSNLSPSSSTEWMTIDPISTGFQDSFPGASIALTIPFDPMGGEPELNYAFYQLDGNDFNYLGSVFAGGQADTSFFTLVQDSDIHYTFPLEFGSNNSDNLAGTNTTNLQGTQIITQRSGSSTTAVDGYGTLYTPTGTFENVLRVKRTEDISDEFNGIATTQEIVRYDWLSPDHRYLLFHTEEIIIRDFFGNEQSRSTQTYYSEAALINNIADVDRQVLPIRCFPNPTADWLQLNLPAEHQGQPVSLKVYNDQGQLVLATSSTNNNLAVFSLPIGNYQITVECQGQFFQASFIKS